MKPTRLRLPLVLVAAVLLLFGPRFARRASSSAAAPHPPSPPHPAGASAAAAIPSPATSTDSSGSAAMRPLPVARENAIHAWTDEDARLPGIIERIAHNPDEAARMLDENDRIHRRQLIYRKDPAGAVVLRARLSGEPVRRLTLPALDGREMEFEIDHADISPSGQSGTFTGHLADQPDSLVTLSFRFGVEAFTVLAPMEALYLQADPREPGEIILKSIDPDTYVPGVCGTPELLVGK